MGVPSVLPDSTTRPPLELITGWTQEGDDPRHVLLSDFVFSRNSLNIYWSKVSVSLIFRRESEGFGEERHRLD